MGVSLTKGGNVSLTKEAPGLTAVPGRPRAGTSAPPPAPTSTSTPRRSWSSRTARCSPTSTSSSSTTSRAPRAPSSTPATTSPVRARATTRRSRSTCAAVPAEVDKIVFPVSHLRRRDPPQSFGQVRNAFIRVVNEADGTEIARYDLTEDASTETAMVFGELYRNGARVEVPRGRSGLRVRSARHRAGLRRGRLAARATAASNLRCRAHGPVSAWTPGPVRIPARTTVRRPFLQGAP